MIPKIMKLLRAFREDPGQQEALVGASTAKVCTLQPETSHQTLNTMALLSVSYICPFTHFNLRVSSPIRGGTLGLSVRVTG